MERGTLFVLLTAFFVSLQPVIIKSAYSGVSGFQMVSLRLFGIFLVFLPLAFHFKKEVRGEMRQWKKFVVPTFLILSTISLFTIGIYFTKNATLTGLLTKSNAIFIPLMTAALFASERAVLLSKRFLLGLFLAALGVIGVVTGGEPITFSLGAGILMIVASQVFWSLYSVSIKALISKRAGIHVLSFILPVAFFLSLPVAFIDVRASGFPAFTAATLSIASGISIGLAYFFQFKAIEEKGLIVTNAFNLTSPLLTGLLGLALFGEFLTAAQTIFAVVLLTGAYFIIRCKCDVRQFD